MHDTVSQVQVRAMEVEVVSCLQVHPPRLSSLVALDMALARCCAGC